MKDRRNVLVVEDDVYIANTYKDWISELDVDVDIALNKDEALERIKCKWYNVILVDIMLKNSPGDKSGVDVIEYVAKIKEGSIVYPVTATKEIDVAIDTYDLDIEKFIRKGQVNNSDDLLKYVKVGLDKSKCNLFGDYPTLSAFLSAPELVTQWEYSLADTVGGIGCGIDKINESIYRSLNSFLPILRAKDEKESLIMDKECKSAGGRFWSKGLGIPIWFSIANVGGKFIEPTSEYECGQYKENEKGKLKTKIYEIYNTKREEFFESVWDKY